MQLDPKFPIEAASGFKEDNLRSAAVGAGIAYQSISGNFQNMGFSASRMSELPQRDNFKIRQEHMIDGFVREHFNEWLKYAILSGTLRLANGELIPITRLEELQNAAQFQGRRWAYVNPLQDEQAAIMAEEAGYISPQQIQAEREDGVPLDELYSEIEEARDLQDAHGLSFEEVDPTQPTLEKGNPDEVVPRPGEAEPEPKKGGKQTLRKGRARGQRFKRALDLLIMQGDGRNGNGKH